MNPEPDTGSGSFYETLLEYKTFDFGGYFRGVSHEDIRKSLQKDRLAVSDLLNLLSDRARDHLEAMAQKAHRMTVQYFGRTINLYIPLYISNYCSSECIYCGFNLKNRIRRKKLTLDEIDAQGREIARTGMKHILVLTGESRKVTPLSYIEAAVDVLKRYFPSVSIEMFPMTVGEYRRLKGAGVDGLTLYQEVYDEAVYRKVHLSGEKREYRYRLDAPERGALAGFRMVNIGALFGLGEKRREAFFTALHAKHLEDKYPDTEISISLPRINPAEGSFVPYDPVDDVSFVQFLTAFRLFLPRAGMPISTRESAAFRDRLIHLGATRFSAGSKTQVGGYREAEKKHTGQFEISDDRDVGEIVAMIREKGYQPVFKDWELF
jgi:2-iminoacetate synthase